MTTTKQRKPQSEIEKVQMRQKRTFKRRIRNTFTGAGFTYIPTGNHQMYIGNRYVEIDSAFVYENIWLLCEDTIATTDIRDHIIDKNEAFGEIRTHLPDVVNMLTNLLPDYKNYLNKYKTERIKIFGLYIPLNDPLLFEDDYKRYSNLTFVLPKTFNYFRWIVGCIKQSARTEIFRFLGIKDSDIGKATSSSEIKNFSAPIIYPRDFTGIEDKVRIVSFMMSAEDLLSTGFVLRKDNWEDSIWLYQRLINKGKIKKIRDFIDKKGEAFYNNVIVALPDNIKFKDDLGNFVDISEINELKSNCELILPRQMNSICIIDGQHRVFAHYESGVDSRQERHIAELRSQLHLLVTGLVFDKDVGPEERAKIQSEIFHDINSNTTKVPRTVLTQIKRIQNPIDDESLAQSVIERLNREGIFRNMLQISPLDSGRIKTTSIVRFALRYLVTVTPADGKESLFNYWDGDKEGVKAIKDEAIQEYIKYCSGILREYFGAVRKNLGKYWEDPDSKLLSVTSINGFIIALTRQLAINGVKDFAFYDYVFSGWDFDFSKNKFPYTSSQYRKFSVDILREAFDVPEDVIKTI